MKTLMVLLSMGTLFGTAAFAFECKSHVLAYSDEGAWLNKSQQIPVISTVETFTSDNIQDFSPDALAEKIPTNDGQGFYVNRIYFKDPATEDKAVGAYCDFDYMGFLKTQYAQNREKREQIMGVVDALEYAIEDAKGTILINTTVARVISLGTAFLLPDQLDKTEKQELREQKEKWTLELAEKNQQVKEMDQLIQKTGDQELRAFKVSQQIRRNYEKGAVAQ